VRYSWGRADLSTPLFTLFFFFFFLKPPMDFRRLFFSPPPLVLVSLFPLKLTFPFRNFPRSCPCVIFSLWFPCFYQIFAHFVSSLFSLLPPKLPFSIQIIPGKLAYSRPSWYHFGALLLLLIYHLMCSFFHIKRSFNTAASVSTGIPLHRSPRSAYF